MGTSFSGKVPFGRVANLLKYTYTGFLTAIAGLILTSASLLFIIPEAGAASSSIKSKLEGLTDQQREKFGIVQAKWVEATGTLPANAYFLTCQGCAEAQYDPVTGVLVHPEELNKIPTSSVLRIPDNWNGKLIIMLGGGAQPHTTFPQFLQDLFKEGYAVVFMKHQGPGDPGFPYDDFVEPPYSPGDYPKAYFAMSHSLKDLVSAVFGGPQATYALGASQGVLRGYGPMVGGMKGSPFDGYLLVSGGNGVQTNVEDYIESLNGNQKVPLTCLPILPAVTSSQSIIGPFYIALVDPEYINLISSGQASSLDYNVTDQSFQVQKDWAKLAYSGDIQRKTIVLQGLRDRSIWPEDTLKFVNKIVDAGKTDDVRLFLYKAQAHGGMLDPPAFPPPTIVESLHKLDAWVQENVEPGPTWDENKPINLDSPPSCTTLGHPDDPYGCFDHIFFYPNGEYFPDSEPPC